MAVTPPKEVNLKVGGGKSEVSALPRPSDDLSAGSTPDISKILAEDIKDRQRLRMFQTVGFFGAGILILVTFAALFGWVYVIGTHVTDANVTTTYRVSFFVAPVIVLATLAALLTLALLKLAFRSPGDKNDEEPSFITLLQGLGNQALEIWKSYAGKKEKGE
jgi:hypothetical protein